MDPIVLNRFGETLGFDISFATPNDDTPMKDAALIHGACGEPASVSEATPTHNGIFCAHCGRIPCPAYVPKEVVTCGELRQWCAEVIQRKKVREEQLSTLWNSGSF